MICFRLSLKKVTLIKVDKAYESIFLIGDMTHWTMLYQSGSDWFLMDSLYDQVRKGDEAAVSSCLLLDFTARKAT